MVFTFILGVALNSVFADPPPILRDESVHFVARRPIFIKKTRPFPLVRNNFWGGKFSARNFSGKSGQIKLSRVKQSLKTAMKSLPAGHLRGLKTIEIRNQTHFSRGMGNGEKIILHTKSIESKKELLAVFLHELGHVVDLGMLFGKSDKKSEFRDGKNAIFSNDPSIEFYKISWEREKIRQKSSNRADFVSGYAMTDCFEDFAESYLFFRLHGEKFRVRATKSAKLRAKYDFLRDRVFGGREFQLKKRDGGFLSRGNFIFDATLIDFSMRDFNN